MVSEITDKEWATILAAVYHFKYYIQAPEALAYVKDDFAKQGLAAPSVEDVDSLHQRLSLEWKRRRSGRSE